MNHNTTFKQRATIPDIADEKFQEYSINNKKITYCRRYGFDERQRTPINIWMDIPRDLRLSPDFFVIANKKPYFVEVKGCASIFRLKVDDLEVYRKWNNNIIKDVSLIFYIYSASRGFGLTKTFEKLETYIDEFNTGVYKDNNKKYYKIDFEDIILS